MASGHNEYAPGYKSTQVKHHEWRTAENSAAHLLPTLESMRERNPNLTVLDVGTGSGTIATSLAARIPEAKIIATDLSEKILVRARELAADTKAKNVAFQQASAYELPFDDNSFDVTHTSQMLCHMDAPSEALREMLRVTKPGGVLSARESDLRTWCYWPDLEGLRNYHKLQIDTHEAAGGNASGGRQLVSWAIKAGASRDKIKASFGTWCYSDANERAMWADTIIARLEDGGIREKGLSLGLASESDLEKMIEAWEKWKQDSEGTLGLIHGEILVFR